MPAFTALDFLCWALRGLLKAAGWVLGALAGLLVRAFVSKPWAFLAVFAIGLWAASL